MHIEDYKWPGLSSLEKGTSKHDRCQAVVTSTSPRRLETYIARLKNGGQCHVEDLVTRGGCHVVRMVTLADGQRWVARFRIPPVSTPPSTGHDDEDVMTQNDVLMQREVDCLHLIARETTVPVPQVKAFGTTHDEFGTPFIMMECLPGNCAIDLHYNFIPEEYKMKFFKQMANAQVQISNLTFPMIGSLFLAEDGSVTVSPTPGIGGPFKTATSFFRAWAATAKFPLSEEKVREGCGPYADEGWERTQTFTAELSKVADRICAKNDCGPFPLVHVDFGHNNMIVDTEYNILGVIDWEHAYAAPWETVDYPLTVWVTPPPIDLPTNYDENGWPKSEELRASFREREQYLQAVKEVEKELDVPPRLSDVLGDKDLQNVATAMRFFKDHAKKGFYTRVLDPFLTDADKGLEQKLE